MVQEESGLKVFQELAKQDLRGQCQLIQSIFESAHQENMAQNEYISQKSLMLR